MIKINEFGRSMVEMLGVLAVIGVLSAGGLAGYGKAMHKYRVQKSISFISDAIIEYQIFTKRSIGNYPTATNKMAQSAKDFGLLSACQPQPSLLAGSQYQTCRFPLGEVYSRFFTTEKADGTYYTYMLYATLLKSPKQSCIDFLNVKWSKIVPDKLWRKGKLWVTSDIGSQVLYSSNVDKLNMQNTINICDSVCGNGSAYCAIIFDFTYVRH